MGCKLLVKVEKFHIGVTWSLSISEADRAFQTTVNSSNSPQYQTKTTKKSQIQVEATVLLMVFRIFSFHQFQGLLCKNYQIELAFV